MIRMNEQSARAAIVALSSALVVIGVAPASAAEVRYDPGDTVYFTYCHAHPPAIRIKPGDTVITRTKDAANDV
jgi:amidase